MNVLTICGSLRKGSYNAMVQRALPPVASAIGALALAPDNGIIAVYVGFGLYLAETVFEHVADADDADKLIAVSYGQAADAPSS